MIHHKEGPTKREIPYDLWWNRKYRGGTTWNESIRLSDNTR